MSAIAATPNGYKAVSKLYNALMTGLVLTLVTQKDADAARRFVFGHFRRQHLEKFRDGLKKLGLDTLPHAVACAQYHYFSNALGGVKTEYMPESNRKAWVRYPPPRWIWSGAAICGIPREVNEAMLHGWHGHNGVTLGNPRLGFVCTGQTVNGDPGLEGYYFEYDREIAPHERVRFVSDEHAPPFDPAKAPKLDSASWPEERLLKVERSYAMEYVRSMLPTMLELFGADEAGRLIGRTARLIGLQYYDEIARLLTVKNHDAAGFAQLLGALAAAQGEQVEVDRGSVAQHGWRLMTGIVAGDILFPAWNELWAGMLAVHNRDLRLTVERQTDTIQWRIASGRTA
ncbi:MAG: hypothetical protein JO294_14585 [Alphaproteobacteria bacterium]|nr:hypothetical protein [Alphaproteobacteria bacterium]MBV9903422.1 hypothetical protein [Alphaproteobacteria bacterium]